MGRISYVNGRYLPHGDATVHIEDRGFQFADAVYEVLAVQNGRLVDFDGHFQRLARSLNELSIPWPVRPNALAVIIRELLRRNRLSNAGVYIQVSRGQAPRDFPFPAGLEPTLVVTVRRTPPFDLDRQLKGAKVITIADIRWKRCDIKSVSLLAGAMGKTQAVQAGAFEAWQVDEAGYVTEGTSSNAWIVTKSGELLTRQTDHAILSGITRQTVMRLADEAGLKHEERPFTVAEAQDAAEAFTTSTTAFIRPVIEIDGKAVGNGETGPFCKRLVEAYGRYMGVDV